MVELGDIRKGLANNAKTISALANRCHDVWPDVVNVPCLIVMPGDEDYLQDGGDQSTEMFTVILLVAPAQQTGTANAQRLLDAYCAKSGAQSVRAALEADRTLGGLIDDLVVRRRHSYGALQLHEGGPAYLGAKWDVQVWY